MTKTWHNRQTEELFRAILSLKNPQEASQFFRDLLTEKEILDFAARWQTAQLLSERVPYSQIEQTTGLSSATIARISKWLNSGMGGYRLMLDRSHHHHAQASLGGKRVR